MSNRILDNLRDPKFYLENFTKIKTKEGGLVPFRLNEAQKDLFNNLRNNRRIMILKCRQLGFSTAVTGYFYHSTIMNPGVTTALIGYNSDLVKELLDKVKTFYTTTPSELRPTIHYNSKYEFTFPKMNSKIMILPSTENVGSGYTIHNCLITELAKIDKAEEKMTSLNPAVPINGTLVIESSPKGQGNLFHRMWMDDNNGYIKKEYHWRWGYTDEQIEIIRRDMNDPQMFAQEYELKFLSSGRSVFEDDIIEEQRSNILKVGDEVNDGDCVKYNVEVVEGLTIYKRPTKDDYIVAGADVGEGVQGGDYSVVTFWNRKTGEEMAIYRGLIPPDRFGEKLDNWGRMFNNALMAVEINNHGLTTITVLKQRGYPNIYFRQAKFELPGNPMSSKLGWKTTKMTRPLLMDEFSQAVRDKNLIIHSKELLDEMSVFVYDDAGNMKPQPGFHDDCLFSAAIAFQGFKVMYDKPLDQLDYNQYLPKSFSY